MLLDEQWAVLEPLVEACRPMGKTPPQDAPEAQRHPLAAPERGEVASDPCQTRTVVAGRAGVHPLGAARRMGEAACSRAGTRRFTGLGLSRRHQHSRPPEGGRRGAKAGFPAQRDHREALGRSRGGYGSKACVIADGQGRAIAFRIVPGQAHELPHAVPLLACLPGIRKWIVADRGYTSHSFRQHTWIHGRSARHPAAAPRGAARLPGLDL